MAITDKSDQEIIEIVQTMIDEVINASNARDWAAFSQYQTESEASDPQNRKHVEEQWENNPMVTSLALDREFLCVLRRGDVAIICWKQRSTEVPGEFLATYHVQERDKEIKEVAFLFI